MNNKTVMSAILTACLSIGGIALAQNSRDNPRDRNDQDQRGQQDRQPDRRDDRAQDRNDNRGQNQVRNNDNRNYDGRNNAQNNQGRGAGPNHDMRKGGRINSQYRSRQYVVDDWRGHQLSAPPRGYHWVQTGGDYVLIAITTGIIAQLLLGN